MKDILKKLLSSKRIILEGDAFILQEGIFHTLQAP